MPNRRRYWPVVIAVLIGLPMLYVSSAGSPLWMTTGPIAMAKDIPSHDPRWGFTMTLRGGNGMEMIRMGWYRITLKGNRRLEVTVFHNADRSLKDGKSVFDQDVSDDQYKAILKGAGEAVSGTFDTPMTGRVEDGLEFDFAATTSDGRREVKWTGRGLLDPEHASSKLGAFIKQINDVIDPKTETINIR